MGMFQNLLPQLTSLGFVRETFDAIVTGTVKAAVEAHNSLAEGSLSYGTTDVSICSWPYPCLALCCFVWRPPRTCHSHIGTPLSHVIPHISATVWGNIYILAYRSH